MSQVLQDVAGVFFMNRAFWVDHIRKPEREDTLNTVLN